MSFVEETLTREEVDRAKEVAELLKKLEAVPLAKMTLGELTFILELRGKDYRRYYNEPNEDELIRLREIEARRVQPA